MDRWAELWDYVVRKNADALDAWQERRTAMVREDYPQGQYEAYMDVLRWMGEHDA